MHIKVKKGLDVPIKGKPEGAILSFSSRPTQLSLNLSSFETVRFSLFKKVGDTVKIGEPLCEDKSTPGRFFVSPAAGTITEIRRGLKRRLMDIVINVADKEEHFTFPKRNPLDVSREELIQHLMEGGIFSKITQRPFGFLANPNQTPRSIFVKALESAPFFPPAEMQVEGYEKEFQTGLDVLKKLTDGNVHLIYRHDTTCAAFFNAEHAKGHTAEGPHPVANASLHIQEIDPIQTSDDVVWTLNAHDVVSIGTLLLRGHTHTERVVSIAGPGIIEGQTGFFRLREGFPIAPLIASRIPKNPCRLISGDPLMGTTTSAEGFLGPNDFVFTVVPENTHREMLHFFRLGVNKYSFSRAYVSGHLDNSTREYDFTTSMHGEHRAYVDASLYNKVMPLKVPTMHLVKSVLAEDYDLAEQLGLLEVAPEDFALPTFVDPSKTEMVDIIRQGLRAHAKELLE